MSRTIINYSKEFEDAAFALPAMLQARYINLSMRMVEHGDNLGAPQTKAFGDGLFELRLKSVKGIAAYLLHLGRATYCDVAWFC